MNTTLHANTRPDLAAPPMPRIKAVVFDMDGLLLNTELLARRALRSAGLEIGLDASEDFYASLIGLPADGCRQLLFEHYGNNAPADWFFTTATRHLHTLINDGALRRKPGVLALLAHLDRLGLPRAVATSSGDKKARHHLEKADIARRFDAIVTRDDVVRGKPAPDLFLEAARRLGQPPSHCLALEDSYNGVRAAHAADMPVVMVPDLLPPTSEMRLLSRAVVPDLHAVIAML